MANRAPTSAASSSGVGVPRTTRTTGDVTSSFIPSISSEPLLKREHTDLTSSDTRRTGLVSRTGWAVSKPKRKLVRSFAAVAVAGGIVVSGSPAASAEDAVPEAVSSAGRYQVTVAARTCTSYAQLMANQVRDDRIEAAAKPGRNSAYAAGQAVDLAVEVANSTGCQPLIGAAFTFGKGWQKKGQLSVVTSPAGAAGPTQAQTAVLDALGQPTSAVLAGAATVALTDEQVDLAAKRQLWIQGGTPDKPVGVKGDAFGVLRCGLDGRSGGNVQWVGFPAGSRHIFCFAYYVRSAGDAGTLVVRAKPTRKVGHPQRFTFEAGASYTSDKTLTVESSGEPADATLVRTAGVAQRVTARVPAGWRLASLTCTKTGAGKSSVNTEPTSGRADVTLAAGEIVTCTYGYEPPAAAPGVTLRVYSDVSSAAPFGITVDGEGGQRSLSAAPRGDGSSVVATGASLVGLTPAKYTVAVSPPAADAGLWTLAGMTCDGTDVRTEGLTGSVTVTGTQAIDCTLRLARKQGRLDLRVVTAGNVGTAAFAVVPLDEAAPGWSVHATTTGFGVPVGATGDTLAALRGGFLVTPIAPKSTVAGGWQLAKFECDAGGANPGKNGALAIAVAADVQCTATYQFVPATRLQAMLRFEGEPDGRASAAVVELSCTDGSRGRVVLPASDLGDKGLPEPLGFLEPTTCTVRRVATGETPDGRVNVVATLSPAPGNAPMSLPATFDVARETDEYLVTVTATYEAGRSRPDQARAFDNGNLLPIALIGGGLVGLGLVMLLVMVVRSRVA
jgi:hypothetical protein